MVAIVDPAIADLTIKSLAARGMKAWIAGSIHAQNGPGAAALEGNYLTR
jgi:phosphoribosylformylglycinamidine cyclo-ligase